MAAGQFCTNPGLVLLVEGPQTESFVATVAEKFAAAPVGPLLSLGVKEGLSASVAKLVKSGAKKVAGARDAEGGGYRYANTLLRVTGDQFIAEPEAFQTEAFGNESLFVVARDIAQIVEIVRALEGNLTGSVYSHTADHDDAAYDAIAPHLRERVGRLLNDKMPTGVAVSAAMQHGGPYPATGHPGFTAVGVPATMLRFGMLQSYDNVREPRLPAALRNKNPNGTMWRRIGGAWTQADVG